MHAASITRLCCSIRRARISPYAISSSTPDVALSDALTAGRSCRVIWLLVAKCSLTVGDHRDPEERQIRDRRVEQRARRALVPGRREPKRQDQESDAEHERDREIRRPADADQARDQARRQQRRRVDRGLAAGAAALRL